MKKLLLLAPIFFVRFTVSAQDPWSKVPASPVECYSDKDSYSKNLDAAETDLKNQITTRTDAIKQKASSMSQEERMKIATQYQNMTPAEITKMQSDQQDLMKMQQSMQEKRTEIDNEFNTLNDQFKKEMSDGLGPVWTELTKLPDGEGTPDWAIKKAKDLTAEYNKEYEDICAKYFIGPASLFNVWLDKYKKYLVETETPLTQQSAKMQYQVMHLTADDAIPQLQSVVDYLDRCKTIFSMRKTIPQGQ